MLDDAINTLYQSFEMYPSAERVEAMGKALERRFGPVVRFLGKGEMGFAVLLKSGKVLKLTTDMSEVDTALKMVGRRIRGFPNYIEVVKVDDREIRGDAHLPLVAILQSFAGDISLKEWLKARGWQQHDIDDLNIILRSHIDNRFEVAWVLLRRAHMMIGQLPRQDLAILANILHQVWARYGDVRRQEIKEFDLHCGNIMIAFTKTGPVVSFIDPGGTTSIAGERQKPSLALTYEEQIMLTLIPFLD